MRPAPTEKNVGLRTVDQIANILQQAIASGDLPPGTVLRQGQLSEELGVSRTPVREALRQLASTGLLTLEPNRSARVRLPSDEELSESYLIRAELEGVAAQFALERMTAADLAELRTAEARFAELSDRLRTVQGSLERRWTVADWRRANLHFHDVIVDAARAPALKRLLQMVKYDGAFAHVTWERSPELDPEYEQAVSEHRAIVEALVRRDEAVGALMTAHIIASFEFVKVIHRNLGPPGALLGAHAEMIGRSGRTSRQHAR